MMALPHSRGDYSAGELLPVEPSSIHSNYFLLEVYCYVTVTWLCSSLLYRVERRDSYCLGAARCFMCDSGAIEFV